MSQGSNLNVKSKMSLDSNNNKINPDLTLRLPHLNANEFILANNHLHRLPVSSQAAVMQLFGAGFSLHTRTQAEYVDLVNVEIGEDEDLDGVRCSHCRFSVGLNEAVYNHLRYDHQEKLSGCDICQAGFETMKCLEEHLLSHLMVMQREANHMPKNSYDIIHSYLLGTCDLNSGFSFRKSEQIGGDHSDSSYYEVTQIDPDASDMFLSYPQNNAGPVLLCGGYGKKKKKKWELDGPYRCSFCELVYSCYWELRQHERSDHTRHELHKCDLCLDEFPWENHLERHIRRVHARLKPFTCVYCHDVLEDLRALQGHLVQDRDGNNRTCKKKLQLEGKVRPEDHLAVHLADHLDIEHKTEITENKEISDSPGKIEDESQMLEHLQNYKVEELKEGQNQRKMEEEVKKTYQCKLCALILPSKQALGKHKKKHEALDPLSCYVCGEVWPDETGLSIHLQIHIVGKDFICHICQRIFHTQHGLTQHLRKGHSQKKFKNAKDYVCQFCGKAFPSVGDLNIHLQSVTHEIVS